MPKIGCIGSAASSAQISRLISVISMRETEVRVRREESRFMQDSKIGSSAQEAAAESR